MLYHSGAGSFGVFSCVLDGVERQQSHRAVYRLTHTIHCKLIVTCPHSNVPLKSFLMPYFRFVPRHADELYLETDDPVLLLNQSEDLWCHGYNMRTGSTGIFPAFYVVKVAKELNQGTHKKKTHTPRCNSSNRIINVHDTDSLRCFFLHLLLHSPERRMYRAVPGAIFGFSSGPHPQRQ